MLAPLFVTLPCKSFFFPIFLCPPWSILFCNSLEYLGSIALKPIPILHFWPCMHNPGFMVYAAWLFCGCWHCFADNEQLRVLELNAWQLFRLLQVRSPRSLCITSLCSAKLGSSAHNHHFKSSQYWGGENEKGDQELCALFRQAIELHESWRHNNFSEVRYPSFITILLYVSARDQ